MVPVYCQIELPRPRSNLATHFRMHVLPPRDALSESTSRPGWRRSTVSQCPTRVVACRVPVRRRTRTARTWRFNHPLSNTQAQCQPHDNRGTRAKIGGIVPMPACFQRKYRQIAPPATPRKEAQLRHKIRPTRKSCRSGADIALTSSDTGHSTSCRWPITPTTNADVQTVHPIVSSAPATCHDRRVALKR